jgi:hypothetical protein
VVEVVDPSAREHRRHAHRHCKTRQALLYCVQLSRMNAVFSGLSLVHYMDCESYSICIMGDEAGHRQHGKYAPSSYNRRLEMVDPSAFACSRNRAVPSNWLPEPFHTSTIPVRCGSSLGANTRILWQSPETIGTGHRHSTLSLAICAKVSHRLHRCGFQRPRFSTRRHRFPPASHERITPSDAVIARSSSTSLLPTWNRSI